jgi:hypothetical protein
MRRLRSNSRMVRTIPSSRYLVISDLFICLAVKLQAVDHTTRIMRKHTALNWASPTYEPYLTPKRHDCQRYHYFSLAPHERCTPRSQVHGQEPRHCNSRLDDRPRLNRPIHYPPRLVTAGHATNRRRAKAQEQGEERGRPRCCYRRTRWRRSRRWQGRRWTWWSTRRRWSRWRTRTWTGFLSARQES